MNNYKNMQHRLQIYYKICIFTLIVGRHVKCRKIVNHYKDKMFFYLMAAGILANELLQEYTNVMKECVESFAVLQRHYLPHNLV